MFLNHFLNSVGILVVGEVGIFKLYFVDLSLMGILFSVVGVIILNELTSPHYNLLYYMFLNDFLNNVGILVVGEVGIFKLYFVDLSLTGILFSVVVLIVLHVLTSCRSRFL